MKYPFSKYIVILFYPYQPPLFSIDPNFDKKKVGDGEHGEEGYSFFY